MKRYIRLINNERTKVEVNMSKACDANSTDICNIEGYDNAKCTSFSYDVCGKDYSACFNNGYDYCEEVDADAPCNNSYDYN